MRNKLIGAGVAALALTVTAGVVASTVGPTVAASKSKAPVTVVEASKSKAPVTIVEASKSKVPVVIVPASKSKGRDVVVIPVSKSKSPTTGDVVITSAAYPRKQLVVVPAAYPRKTAAAVPASYAKGVRAALPTHYYSCGIQATNGPGAVRVVVALTGYELVNATLTVENHQDRAFTVDTNRLWDENGVRKGPGGWIAPGHSSSWTVKNMDVNTVDAYVYGHATTNTKIKDGCSPL
jgi:hypothetical protein